MPLGYMKSICPRAGTSSCARGSFSVTRAYPAGEPRAPPRVLARIRELEVSRESCATRDASAVGCETDCFARFLRVRAARPFRKLAALFHTRGEDGTMVHLSGSRASRRLSSLIH